MAITTAPHSPAVGHRFGYAVAVVVNAAMLYAVNAWPGWQAVPFLTDDTAQVIPWVNTSILVGLVANVVYLVRDPAWLKAVGDIVTTAVGLVAMVRIWQVFPLDFGDTTFDWALLARILLGVGIGGSILGIVVSVVRLVRAVGERAPSQ
jgi:hypothetical protein